MHSPPLLRHVLHFGLSPLQPSFLPEGRKLRQQRGKKNGPTNTNAQAPAASHEPRSKALTSTKIARDFRLLPEPP
jgi:hypothetical protein